ncbi:hypothetical protein [Phenylobacterium sp. J367]|uniref:hypothetical protein n=1 Tax=Phenylobacterium sp. J367 TaxID=2898435 RepID=UPI002151EDAE|nr:hypothetical protein [Phenylobacterium sp. J367]MCR5879547.1 hypothetical protein [Phenylobacterium sp. J367]
MIVDYVASHLMEWSREDPCRNTSHCAVRNRQAYEAGRWAAQTAFAAGDRRGVSVQSIDPEGNFHTLVPGFFCSRLAPGTVNAVTAEDGSRSPGEDEWALGYNDRIWQLGGALKEAGCRLSPDEAMLATPPPGDQRSFR